MTQLLCVLIFAFALQSDKVETVSVQATPEHQSFSHFDFGIIPPKGFVLAPEINGFKKPGTHLRIMMMEMPVSMARFEKDMKAAAQEDAPKILERFILNGHQAFLAEMLMKSPDPSYEDFSILMLVWGNDGKTVQISAAAPVSQTHMRATYTAALKSTAITKE